MNDRACHGTVPMTRTEDPDGSVRYRCQGCMWSVAFKASNRSLALLDGLGASRMRVHLRDFHRQVQP